MTQVQPAFWARYRGTLDPAVPNTTIYTYQLAYTIVGGIPQLLNFSVFGPPQLTRQRFIEVNWSPIVGMIRATVTRASINLYDGPGSECGFIDQGQVTSSTTGVRTG